jgi:predicted P-loop ATPase
MSQLLKVARAYVARGWQVFPLDGKIPYLNTHGLLEATVDGAQLDAWWRRWPAANIGIRTGELAGAGSGIWVLDLDSDTDAEERVDREAEGRPYRDTLSVRTGGGGLHFVYRFPPELVAWLKSNKLQLLTRNKIGGKGLDVRSDGGYIVAVPSVHPETGQPYAWENKAPIIDAPEWLLRMVSKPEEVRRAAPPPPKAEAGAGFGAAVLRNAVAKIAGATTGERHGVLLAQARTVGGYLVSAGISIHEAETQLIAAGENCGKPASEVRRTVRDGLAYGQQLPLSVPERPQPTIIRPVRTQAKPEPEAGDVDVEEAAAPTKLDQGRELLARALSVLYDEATARPQRLELVRELTGSVDLLVEVAEANEVEWTTWIGAAEAAGGMGEHVRNLKRSVKVSQDKLRSEERTARQATRGQAVGKERTAILSRLAKTEEGSVKSTYANIVTILRADPRYASLRCSTLGGVVEVEAAELEEGPGTADLCEWLRDSYGLDAGEVMAKTALYAVAAGRMYSPVKDYLESVRGKGTGDTVGQLLREVLGLTEPTEMQAAMVGRFLISAVARALEPGCKADTALVLVGEQGAKKSSFFEGLFGEFFGDSPIPIGNKDAAIMMSRVWGYEAAELEDLTSKRSAESVKQFLGTRKDLYRPPFARAAILSPRHTVLCGSVNPVGGAGGTAAFLSDPSGSRRFWILTIPAKHVIPIQRLRELRDAVWADALSAYEAGEVWWFTREEDKVREEDAQQYQIEDSWTSPVGAYVENEGVLATFSTSDVLNAIGLDIGQRTAAASSRVRAILVRMGWVEKASPAGFRGLRVWRKA